MFNKIILGLSMGLTLIFTVGCFSDGGGVAFSSSVDYGKTKIVVLGQGIANGNSFLYVEVHVINSNDSPVLNFIPDLGVTDAAIRSCGKTNSAGIARCALTSDQPGLKILTLLNAIPDIEAQAMFLQPLLSKSIISNVPGSSINNISAGHKISASLSNLQVPLKYEHPSGHIVYSTVQGIIFSEE